MATSKPLTVSLEPTPKAAEAITLLTTAQCLAVVDKSSHELALQHLKGAKTLKREIVAHYEAIKKPINVARNTVLDLERQHLAPVEQAIDVLDRVTSSYVRQQERLEREAADRLRREAEAKEQVRRDEEARQAEEHALTLEAASDALSEREQKFVRAVIVNGFKIGDPAHLFRLAVQSGFKAKDAVRLMDSKKINDAIANAQQAAAIRREAEAKQASPIIVDVPVVESQIGKVAGTSMRRYYAVESVDLRQLVLDVAENIQHGDGAMLLALQPNLVYLGEQVRSLKEMASRVWPQVRVKVSDKVAG